MKGNYQIDQSNNQAKTGRSFGKVFCLGPLITFAVFTAVRLLQIYRELPVPAAVGICLLGFFAGSIYPIIFFSGLTEDINRICKDLPPMSRPYPQVFFLSLITGGIYYLVWIARQGERLRGFGSSVNPQITVEDRGRDYVVWHFLILFGHYMAWYRLIDHVNRLAELYNFDLENGMLRIAIDPENPPSKDEPGTIYDFQGVLMFIDGTYAGSSLRIEYGQVIEIGRRPDKCNLVIPNSDISRSHCAIRISMERKLFYVTDHGSTFGTKVNGSTALKPEVETPCVVGTVLTLGNGSNQILLQ